MVFTSFQRFTNGFQMVFSMVFIGFQELPRTLIVDDVWGRLTEGRLVLGPFGPWTLWALGPIGPLIPWPNKLMIQ